MTETLRALAAALAVYAVYLPVALVTGRYYVPVPRPASSLIESIGGFHHDAPDHYFTRLYIFTPKRFPDASKIAVYENLTPLSDVNLTPDAGAYVVRFRASDGSDARTNGRKYWVVAP